MGMAVKGVRQHQLVRDALARLVERESAGLTEADVAHCQRLQLRAVRAIDRLGRRKRARAVRMDAQGYGHGA